MAFLQGLDLAPYLSEAGSLESTGPCTYDLAGVCAHDGKSVNCGHYRAVCRRGLAPSSCRVADRLSGVLRVALCMSLQPDVSGMQCSSISSHRGSDDPDMCFFVYFMTPSLIESYTLGHGRAAMRG